MNHTLFTAYKTLVKAQTLLALAPLDSWGEDCNTTAVEAIIAEIDSVVEELARKMEGGQA